MTRYYADWRFLLQQIGQSERAPPHRARLLGLRAARRAPDVARRRRRQRQPDRLRRRCPNTIAGMGQCMISDGPQVRAERAGGAHASAWDEHDVAGNTNKSVDVATDAKSRGRVSGGLRAEQRRLRGRRDQRPGRRLLPDRRGRTAGGTRRHRRCPTTRRIRLGEGADRGAGKPALYWQTPVGNASQNNTADHYQDNRVDYFFGGSAAGSRARPPTTVPAHWSALGAAHVIGVAFGAGEGTRPCPRPTAATWSPKTKAYVSAGGQPLCQ